VLRQAIFGVANGVIDSTIQAFNSIVKTVNHGIGQTSDPDLFAIRTRALVGTDISSHLETIFLEALRATPRLIVELGVRTGESTLVFVKVARRCGATLVSVDIDPCSSVCKYDKWHFVQEDDVRFGQRFADWCLEHDVSPKIDVLFIDTSHLYQHTLAEIDAWFPHLGAQAVVFFHDTNLRRFFRRRDHTIGRGWNNSRGVIRALETRFGARFDERRPFRRELERWQVLHDPVCNGLTILTRSRR
jgi:cephalosporin hydroxylase